MSGRKIRSMRGEEVDFDLINIKKQLNTVPVQDVKLRKKFIEERTRRRTKVIENKVADKKATALGEDSVENSNKTPTIISESTTVKQKTKRRNTKSDIK